MSQQTYNTVSGVVFLIFAALHLLRALMGLPAALGEWTLPIWGSWVAVVVAGYLSYSAFTQNK